MTKEERLERQERNEKIIALYKEHQLSLKEIGEMFGMTKQNVSLILKNNNIEMEYPRDRILAYCKSHKMEDINIADLAKRFNTSPIVISSLLNSNKIAHSRSIDSRQKRIQATVKRLKSMDTPNMTIDEIWQSCIGEDNYPSRITLVRMLHDYDIPHKRKSYTRKIEK